MPLTSLRKAAKMSKPWSYKQFQVKEGLKPGSPHFQYFFVVSEDGVKKCNYCVWIEDDALSRFHESKDFSSILSSFRDQWSAWVKSKIDQGDFRNVALVLGKSGEEEIDLALRKDHVSPE
jgi:hypothetical protein